MKKKNMSLRERRYRYIMIRLLFVLLISCTITGALTFTAGYLAGMAHEQLKIKQTISNYFGENETEENK